MPLPALDILVAVVDAGSITAAAERLGTPRTTVSRWLTGLEEEVGVRLLQRTTRRLVLTEAGEELYRHARSIVDAVQAATEQVRAKDNVPRGLIRVSMPPGGDGMFGRMIATFLARHPAVRIELTAATRHVDLISEGFDVAIRAGRTTQSSLITRTLARHRAMPYASPAYLQRAGRPGTAAELVRHDCIVGFARGETPRRTWPLLEGGVVDITPRMACNDLATSAQAAAAGAGIALLPELFGRNDALVPVLEDVVGMETALTIVFSERRLMLPRVRAFIDHVTQWVEHKALIDIGRSL